MAIKSLTILPIVYLAMSGGRYRCDPTRIVRAVIREPPRVVNLKERLTGPPAERRGVAR